MKLDMLLNKDTLPYQALRIVLWLGHWIEITMSFLKFRSSEFDVYMGIHGYGRTFKGCWKRAEYSNGVGKSGYPKKWKQKWNGECGQTRSTCT